MPMKLPQMRPDAPKAAALRLCLLVLAGLTLAGCGEASEQTVESLMERATAQRDKGELRASAVDLKSLLQLDPKNAAARVMLGRIYLDTGDASSAEKELKAAQDLGGNAFEIKYLIGRAWLLRGAYGDLLKEYKVTEDLKAAPRSKILLLRGKAHLARRQLTKANIASY